MPEIWENILSNVSGSDLANCLKVCKALRSMVIQCVESSSRFRHKVNCAATASAIAKGYAQSGPDVFFRLMPTAVWSLDGVWYDRSGRSIIRFCPTGCQMKPFGIMCGDSQQFCHPDESTIHSTTDDYRFVLSCHSQSLLLNICFHSGDIVDDPEAEEEEEYEIQPWFQEPNCLRYRLFEVEKGTENELNDIEIVMGILNSRGEITKKVTLYRFTEEEQLMFPRTMYTLLDRRHLSSNEEVTGTAMQ